MLIEDDVWVTLRYRLFDSQGEAIEPAERELTYLQGGYGAVFPQIEEALAGHGVGFDASVYLEPEDSFGDYDPELVRLAPRSDFPGELEIGMTFEGVPGEPGEDDGELLIVTDFTDEAVVLDANHPLAGMALRFDLHVVDVRPASADEIERERELAGEDPEREADGSLLRRRSARDEDDGLDDEDERDDGYAGTDGDDPGGGPQRGESQRRRLH